MRKYRAYRKDNCKCSQGRGRKKSGRKAEEKRREEMRKEAERKKREEEAVYNKFNPGTIHKMGVYNHGMQIKDIEWRVLERDGNRALLISNYIIDRQKFNESSENTSWEKCSLRKWLNNDFYNTAFSSSGNDTNDKIFLLSIDEVKKYFPSDAYTRCQVTLFAKNKGAYCDGAYFGYWWLRTTGQSLQNATYIFYSGGISDMGYDVTGIIFGVRPAMWVSLA